VGQADLTRNGGWKARFFHPITGPAGGKVGMTGPLSFASDGKNLNRQVALSGNATEKDIGA